MKKTVIILITLLLVSQIAFVMAEVTVTKTSGNAVTEASSSWLSRLISSIKYSLLKQNTFTIYGQELGCEEYPDPQNVFFPFTKGDDIIASAMGETYFINWFRGSPNDGEYPDHPTISREFVREDFITGQDEANWVCDAGAYWNNQCYMEYYLCDKAPCYSNSDCVAPQICDKTGLLHTKVPNAGVCRVSIPTHKTKVYSCSNGVSTYVGEVSYGNANFCMDSTDKKYLIGTTDQCLDYVPSACTSSGGGNGGACTPSCTGKCGGVSDGCSGTCDASCGGGSDCGNGVCSISERLISPCPQDCEKEVKGEYSILNVAYGDAVTGAAVTNPKPGQLLKVTFQVKSESLNTDPKLVEAGIIPFSTAQDWTMDEPSGFWSIFAIQGNDKNACCLGQSNVADNSASLTSTLWSDSRLIDFSYTLRVPDSTTTDVCNMGNTYWNDSSNKYVLYVTVKNGCYKDGYRKGVFVSQVLNLNYESNETSIGSKCTNDFECATGEKCLDAPGWLTGKTCQGGGGAVGGNSLIDVKKIALTRDQISKSTSGDLLGAACLGDAECVLSPNADKKATAKCIPISSLREDGTLTEIQKTNLFSNAGNLLNSALYGGAAGAVICTAATLIPATAAFIGLGPGALLATPAIYGGCTAVGAVLGVALTQASAQLSNSDNLVKLLKAKNADQVGICTAEAGFNYCKYTEWAAFFPITKDKCTSGLIIIIAGFLIIMFVMNMGNRK